MLNIFPIAALLDNYIWCLVRGAACVIVDPGEAEPVISYLRNNHLNLVAILLTHHHGDHTQGVQPLLKYKEVPVFGPASIIQVTHPLFHDTFYLGAINIAFNVIKVPGHTLEHVAYYWPNQVLTGDTLFTAGCGKIFEGSVLQMYESLSKLKRLPDETWVYCGHEYTEANLWFALEVEPNNPDIRNRMEAARQLRLQKLPTVPALLKLEKSTNPFLRCEEPEIINAVSNYVGYEVEEPVQVLGILREWKNNFSG
jgi:hydroxyacylglutathione hydrolase